jgi:hypothetical protein
MPESETVIIKPEVVFGMGFCFLMIVSLSSL